MKPMQSIPLSFLALLPVSALAHVGHIGFAHPFSGLDHILAMLAVGILAAQQGGAKLWALPSSFVLAMLGGGIMGMNGIVLPYLEAGILASVLVLGALIVAAYRLPLVAACLFIALCAIFHGYAHGLEMPLTSNAFGYGLGFLFSTMLLHVMGIGIGSAVKTWGSVHAVRWSGAAIMLGGMYLAI